MKLLSDGLGRRFPAARLALCVILVVAVIGVPASPAQAAGIYTHTWFVERAIQRLAAQGEYAELVSILNKYPATVNYGALFPDITMTNDRDWAEIAHDTVGARDNYAKYKEFLDSKGYDPRISDLQTTYYKEFLKGPNASIPPFRKAIIDQMMDHFRNNPRSEGDEQMIAFLFGVIAHQEADVPWHLHLPNCVAETWRGQPWLGLECAASMNELQIDMLLYHYDTPEHTVSFDFLYTVHPLIYAAVDAAGIRRPWYNLTCLTTTDPLWCGEGRMETLWGLATTDGGANDEAKRWLETYVPGGVEYGSALVAAAWMDTWDRFAPAAPELPIGQLRSLQSHNYPNHYLRHQNWRFRIDPIATDLDRRDATLRIVPGLADSGCVSFEPLNFPNNYLHDEDEEVDLAPFEDTPSFRAEATFCARAGLADANKVSFESYEHPGSYLRHADYWLWVHPWDGADQFRADATFSVVAPLGLPKVYLPLVVK